MDNKDDSGPCRFSTSGRHGWGGRQSSGIEYNNDNQAYHFWLKDRTLVAMLPGAR